MILILRFDEVISSGVAYRMKWNRCLVQSLLFTVHFDNAYASLFSGDRPSYGQYDLLQQYNEQKSLQIWKRFDEFIFSNFRHLTTHFHCKDTNIQFNPLSDKNKTN